MPRDVVSLDRARELAFIEEQLEDAVLSLAASTRSETDPLWRATNALYAAVSSLHRLEKARADAP